MYKIKVSSFNKLLTCSYYVWHVEEYVQSNCQVGQYLTKAFCKNVKERFIKIYYKVIVGCLMHHISWREYLFLLHKTSFFFSWVKTWVNIFSSSIILILVLVGSLHFPSLNFLHMKSFRLLQNSTFYHISSFKTKFCVKT